ncbi:MAG TPA: WG repeat-containing protein [Saprospiraceae bacterium]|nr:WG repeat-containing protein [Saprospiraceae bacterium]
MKNIFANLFNKVIGLSCLGILLHSVSDAQQILIPYFSNGLYGVSDDKGKIVIQPAFEEVNVRHGIELVAFRQNGLWGIMDRKGKVLFTPAIKVEVPSPNYAGRSDGPFIQNVFRKTTDGENEIFADAHLYSIVDDYAHLEYYINPYASQVSYSAFVNVRKIKRESEGLTPCNPGLTGILKVGTRDQMFNFIDTSGRVLFKKNVFNGEALSPEILAVENEKGKVRMVNNLEQPISDFLYDKISRDDGEFIIAMKKDTVKKSSTYYSLFTTSGKLIVKDLPYRMETTGKIALIEENNITTMYNQSGDKVTEFENANMWPMSHGKGLFFISIQKQFGIVDEKGKFILKPTYTSMKSFSNGKFAFTLDQKGGLLDEELKPIWTLDSISVTEECYGIPGYYKVQKTVPSKYGTKEIYGIADSTGKIIIYPEYKNISYHQRSKIMEVNKDSLRSLVDLNGKVLLPFTKDHLDVHDGNNTVTIYSKEKVVNLNLTTMKATPLQMRPQKAMAMKNNNLFYLADAQKTPLTEAIYKSLTPHGNSDWPGTVFVGLKTEGNAEFVDILNEKGKNIIPAGYGVYAQHANQSIKRNLVTVFNKEDAIKFNSDRSNFQLKFRSGAIDFNGAWIIPPDYQVFSNLGNRILRVGNLETNQYALYDFQGRLITSVNYTYVQEPKDDNFKFNRVIVGIPVDPGSYAAFADKLVSEPGLEELKRILEDKNSIPKMKVGAIDLNGKEVIPLDFLKIDPFVYSLTTASKMDKNGNTYSVIIDTMGKEMFRSDFESISFMSGDSTQLIIQTGKNKGVSDFSGKVIIEPAYEVIYYYKEIDGYIVRSIDSSYFISKKTPGIRIAIGRAGNPDHRSLDDQFFYTSMQDKDDYKKSYFHFFDKQGHYFGEISGNHISTNVFGAELPKGYIAVMETKDSKPYVVNIRTGMKYRKN